MTGQAEEKACVDMEENKVIGLLEKHKVRIAAGVQLMLCFVSLHLTFKKELRKMKKKRKK